MDNLHKWLWLTVKSNISIAKTRHLIEHFKDIDSIYNAKPNDFLNLKFLDDKEMMRLSDKSTDGIDEYIETLKRNKVKVVTIDMPEYPALLKSTFTPPFVLYCRGKFIDLNKYLCISVVGTRKPTSYGISVAKEMAYKLAKEGIIIVSGMAYGIDSIAHRAALKAGMPTVAVLGCGINRAYPTAHANLMSQIIKTGMVISEYPPNTKPLKHHFPERNRIIAGLSVGSLFVEAAINSGSLITAKLCCDNGRDVFSVPGDINSLYSQGTNNLIKEGAKLVTNADEVLEDYKNFGSSFFTKPYHELLYTPENTNDILINDKNEKAPADNPKLSNYPKQEDAILKILGSRPMHIDVIAQTLDTTPAKISSILLTLELEGKIESHPGDAYSLSFKQEEN